jgi:hypothetical protein
MTMQKGRVCCKYLMLLHGQVVMRRKMTMTMMMWQWQTALLDTLLLLLAMLKMQALPAGCRQPVTPSRQQQHHHHQQQQ